MRSGVYRDSVTLLRISQAASDTPGVTAAQVAMATPLNIELAEGLGFAVAGAGPNDLLITLRGDDAAALAAGMSAVESALNAVPPAAASGTGVARPRTVRSATAMAPEAAVVLLSVPGSSVIGEALDAIAAGRHVMIFSDNVPVDQEVALKTAAEAAGVLVMGPDCGTAIIGGVGLGFANTLRDNESGPRIGVVAASGTGAQQLTCLLDDAGVTVSHVLGVGGRDLSEAVAGRSTITALRLLDADPGTDHIVLISKPPHPATAATVLGAAAASDTPVTSVLLGPGSPDITAGVEQVLAAVGAPVPVWRHWEPTTNDASSAGAGRSERAPRAALRGLFSGGTLADEAMLVAGQVLGDIRSNIPLRPDLALPGSATRHGRPHLGGLGHVILDLGDDEFTLGRPHPMIDPALRLDLFAEQSADPDVAVLLLDVVLGHGADPDPARRWAPAIRDAIAAAAAAGRALTVVVSLCGTDGDPQGRDAQAEQLVAAGARVFVSNAAAARAAAEVTADVDVAGDAAVQVDVEVAVTAAGAGPIAASPTVPADDVTGPDADRPAAQPPSASSSLLRHAGRRRPARRPTVGDHRRDRSAGRRAARAGRRRHHRRLPATEPAGLRRIRRSPRVGHRPSRPPHQRGERAGRAADAGHPGRAGRRPAGPRGVGAATRRVLPRRSADRVRPRVGTAARRVDRRVDLRGAGRRRGRGGRETGKRAGHLAHPLPRAARGGPDGRGDLAVHVAVRADRPGDRSAGVVLVERGPGQGAAVRRLRTRGDHPAALDGRRPRAGAGRGGAGRPARSTSPRSSGRWCRWATRATTGTAPAP